MGTLPLFDEPSDFDREALARRLQELANEQIFLGGSSWKYEGWLGQIYSDQRYLTRGRFSKKKFEQDCLAEYAETFPIVCGDFSFYQFPTDDFWKQLFSRVPPSLKFALKVPEEITVKRFPVHPRYGPKAGLDNPTYLNYELFEANFLRPLEPHQQQIAVLILEFGTFPKGVYEDVNNFLAELEPFLAALPKDRFHFAIEVRNPEFLRPEYFEVLSKNGVAHVFNSWTRMPPIEEQIKIPGAFTAPFIVARALLRPGRSYEKAVESFSPYTEIRDPNPEVREAIKNLISEARQRKIPGYLFVNNRLEGNSPMTIKAVVEDDDAGE